MTKRPNVIYILADDMGYGDFSAFNSDGPKTPAIDRLISEGVTLSNCYSSSPVCAPARASILTGRYPQRCGVIDTLEARGYDRLKLTEITLADILKNSGYQTALIGKWHLGAIDNDYHPNNRGFDEFIGFRGGWNDYYHYHIEHNGVPLPCAGEYLTNLFSNAAVEYVRKHADHPFFLHLTYNAPHFPLQAPKEVIAKYEATGKYSSAVCKLYAMIEIMDQGIGHLLNALDELQISENTIVIFSSDNGPDMSGEGDNNLKRYNCNLRAEKMYVYEGGIRVPAVIRYANAYVAGSTSNVLVHGTDWFPTLLSLCGIQIPDKLKIDGIDVSKQISEQQSTPARTLFWQWCRYKPDIKCNAALREGDRKLIHAPVWEYLDLPKWEIDIDVDIKNNPENYPSVIDKPIPALTPIENPEIQLYLIDSDPHEQNDLVDQFPDEVKRLEDKLLNWFNEVERDRLA